MGDPPSRQTLLDLTMNNVRFVRAHRVASAAIAAAVLLCVMGSCATSSTPSQTNPPPTAAPATTGTPTTTAAATAAACEDVAELRSSLEALTEVKPAQNGVAALKPRSTTSRPAWTQRRLGLAGAQAQRGTGEDGIRHLADGGKRSDRDNFKEKAPSIVSAMKQVVTATEALSATLTQSCPGS
jgi:hypothetical protein